MDHAQALVARVFKDDYGMPDMPDAAFVWLHSGNQAKVSLHLIINWESPKQIVFRSNHQDDPQVRAPH